jgi:hypothetical protein
LMIPVCRRPSGRQLQVVLFSAFCVDPLTLLIDESKWMALFELFSMRTLGKSSTNQSPGQRLQKPSYA